MSDRRQFVACQFEAGKGRAYTYHNDGEPVVIGDRVIVEMRGGAKRAVEVVSLPDAAPEFETKPILGLEADAPAEESEGETE